MTRTPTPSCVLRLALCVALAGCGGSAPAPPAQVVSPGMRGVLTDLVLPGSELEAKPRDTHEAPIVLRVLAARPHGTDFRYDLEWYGLEPGPHDLRDFLQRVDGSAMTGVPAIPVTVTDILAARAKDPARRDEEFIHPIAPGALPSLGGYTALLWAGGIAWGIGVLALLLLRRRAASAAAGPEAPATFADRLRPLVQQAMAGTLPSPEQARLERMLVAFWRAKLDLAGVPAAEALTRLRAHDDAGALLRQLEAWLHMPPGRRTVVAVATLLAPYRALPADAYERLLDEGPGGGRVVSAARPARQVEP